MRPTGIVRLPCKLLMAAWASVCPWNFTKAQPATKQSNQLTHMSGFEKKFSLCSTYFQSYLYWYRQALSTQCTHLCCQRVRTACAHPRRSVAFPACQQTTSCPLKKENGKKKIRSQLFLLCKGICRFLLLQMCLFLKATCPLGCSIDHRECLHG